MCPPAGCPTKTGAKKGRSIFTDLALSGEHVLENSMMKYRFFVSLGLAIALGLSLLTPARAENYSPRETYRDAQQNLYFANRTPNAQVTLTYRNMERQRDVQANGCGWIVLRNAQSAPVGSTVKVAGEAIAVANLPTQLLPRCTGNVPEEARSTNFKTAAGDVVIVGQTPSAYVRVSTFQDRVRKATVNSCGVARFSYSPSWAFDGSSLFTPPGGGTLTPGEISEVDAVPVCRSGQLYIPRTWISNS